MKRRLIILGVSLFFVFIIYYAWHSSNLLDSKGRYTIGTVDRMKPAGNGIRVYISFLNNNIKQERDYVEDIGYVRKLHLGQRLFVKYVRDNSSTSFDFNPDCQVPDSVMIAPPEGWDKEWLQKKFPCIEK